MMDQAREPVGLPRGVVAAALSIGAVLVLLFVGHLLRPQLDLPLNSLRVEGQLQRVTAAQIAAAAAIPAGERLFAADLDAVRARVEKLPWIGHARVSRHWPDGLTVRVWEREPVALWGEGGLLDAENRAFVPPAGERPAGLPQLAGPAGREADVMVAYRALSASLAGSRFVPDGLTLDARGEWQAHTTGGIVLRFGDAEPSSTAAVLTGPATRALEPWLDAVASIDLHYANGFATGWKNGIAPFPKPAKARPAVPAANAAATAKEPL